MIAARVVTLRRGQEVARDQLGALVDQLVESMLTVGARLPPDDRAGRIIDARALAGDALAIALHIALLEVRWEVHQVLIVRQNGMRLGVEEVVVPDAQQPHHHGQILREGRGAEVFIHGMGAAQQGFEVVHAQVERNRKADRRPQRIAAPDPIPELEHVLGVNAKLCHRGCVGGHRGEVPGDGSLIVRRGQEPSAGRLRVSHRFLRGEGLGGYQEEHRFGVHELQGLDQVRAVNVGNEVHA